MKQDYPVGLAYNSVSKQSNASACGLVNASLRYSIKHLIPVEGTVAHVTRSNPFYLFLPVLGFTWFCLYCRLFNIINLFHEYILLLESLDTQAHD